MSYIDKNKIDLRLPYLNDEDGDAFVSVRDVRNIISLTPAEDVISKNDCVKALVATVNTLLDFAKENSYQLGSSEAVVDLAVLEQKAKELLEEYNAEKDS
jgi:hypothetical protein